MNLRASTRTRFQFWLLPLFGVTLVALLVAVTRGGDNAPRTITLASELIPDSPAISRELDPLVHVDATDYGNARHVVADRNGALMLAYVDLDGSSSAIVFFHSLDEGRSWKVSTDRIGPGALRPALAYDPVSDKLHVLYHAGGSDERSDARYRRYTIARNASGQIDRLAFEGELVLHARNSSRGALLWTPDGGPHGSVVAAWTAFDGAARRDIRVTMRALSNDATDFRAASWSSPDGAPDKVPDAKDAAVPVDVVGIETSTPIPRSYQGQFHRLGLAGLVQRQHPDAAHARDLYVVYTLIGPPDATWKWTKADWNPGAALWSGTQGWTKPQRVNAGNFDRGRVEKELTLSTIYDDANDIVWFAAAHFVPDSAGASGHDTVSLFSILPDDSLGEPHEVYSVRDETTRHPMTSLALDVSGGDSVLYVAYTTGHEPDFDGHLWLRPYSIDRGFGQPITLYKAAPSNYASLLERSLNHRLHGIFRTQPNDYAARYVTVALPDFPAPPPASAGASTTD